MMEFRRDLKRSTSERVAQGSGFPSGWVVKNLPVNAGMQEMQVWSLDQEDSLEEGMATHSSIHSCLENSMDRGAWWAAVSGVAQSQILLKQLSSSSSSNNIVNQFLTRVPRQFSFQQMVLGQLHTHRQKNGTGLLSYTTQKLSAN